MGNLAALERAIGDKPRERIEGLTPEQRFFLSFAQLRRSVYRPELERHLPEFDAAFECRGKTELLPAKERAAIW
jgi:putative endopeptidase